MSDNSYPAELIKKATARIQKQLDGNNIDPKTIEISTKSQDIGVFHAQTSYTLDVTVKTSTAAGQKIVGKLIETGQSKPEIDAYLDEFESKDSYDETAKNLVQSLPLKGFGAKIDVVALEGESIDLTEHAPCSVCQAQGQTTCPTCRGQCQSQCTFCYGRGLKQCMLCNGVGEIQSGDNRQICTQCQGKREVFCTQCQGQRTVPCGQCQAKGSITCQNCGGQGSQSVFYNVRPHLKVTSDIYVAELDEGPKRYVVKLNPLKLAENNHAAVEVTDPPEHEADIAYYDDEPDNPYAHCVYYKVTMPWGIFNLNVINKTYKLAMIGEKGAIAECEPFMDDVLQQPINDVREAARNNGDVSALLKQACDYRVSRETLASIIKIGPKKTIGFVQKNYGIGFKKETIQSFVKNAYTAEKNITRKPRYIGLGLGLILSIVMHYYWFLKGGNGIVNLPNSIGFISDILPFGIGVFVTILSIKLCGFFAFKNVMGSIGIEIKKLPPVGKAGLYGFIGCLVMNTGFIIGQYLGLY